MTLVGCELPTAKRALDVIVSAAFLLALSPVLVVCGLAVWLSSPGPILFRQMRLGIHGQPFRLLKFRSMYDNAPDLRNPDGSAYTSNQDLRVTRVGRLLRRTSLDELPQLVNVLRGEMSLVGPRPDQLDQIQFYTETERQKLSVRPGLTGLAQISGRNNIPWESRKALDVMYIARQSIWLDLAILAKTIPCVLRSCNINSDASDSSSLSNISS